MLQPVLVTCHFVVAVIVSMSDTVSGITGLVKVTVSWLVIHIGHRCALIRSSTDGRAEISISHRVHHVMGCRHSQMLVQAVGTPLVERLSKLPVMVTLVVTELLFLFRVKALMGCVWAVRARAWAVVLSARGRRDQDNDEGSHGVCF